MLDKTNTAASYLSDAHDRMIAKLAYLRPAVISVNPSADEFNCQREHIQSVAQIVDEYLHAVAVDGAMNSHEIKSDQFVSVVGDAVHDTSLLGSFGDAAEAVEREAEYAA